MRLWLSKNSEVPLREQLVRQIMLGVVSDDLKPGQRLPSTRELARRFRIHSNTVSAAYRELERQGLVAPQPGRGTFITATLAGAGIDAHAELKTELQQWITRARKAGLDDDAIQALFDTTIRKAAQAKP